MRHMCKPCNLPGTIIHCSYASRSLTSVQCWHFSLFMKRSRRRRAVRWSRVNVVGPGGQHAPGPTNTPPPSSTNKCYYCAASPFPYSRHGYPIIQIHRRFTALEYDMIGCHTPLIMHICPLPDCLPLLKSFMLDWLCPLFLTECKIRQNNSIQWGNLPPLLLLQSNTFIKLQLWQRVNFASVLTKQNQTASALIFGFWQNMWNILKVLVLGNNSSKYPLCFSLY